MTSQTLSQKEQRMAKAARLRYKENKDTREIAKELKVKPQTVRKYFSDDRMEDLKRKFSDQEKYKLEKALEQDIWDGEQEAKNALSQALSLAETSKDYRQVADSLMKIRQRKVDLLQELGVVKKPKERKEVTDNSGEVVFNEELVTERQEENEDQDGQSVQEVEAK